MRVKLKSTGQLGNIPDNRFDPNLFEAIESSVAKPPETTFAQRAGADLGANIRGILSLPGLLVKIGQGLVPGGKEGVSLPEVGGALLSGVLEEGKELTTDPIGTFKQKPVSTILNLLPFLQLGKAGLVGKAGRVADVTSDISKVGKVADTAGDVGKIGRLESILSKAEEPSKIATSIRSGIVRPKVPVGPTAVSKEAEIVEGLKSLGIKGSAQSQRLQIDQLYKAKSAEIGEILDASTKTYNSKSIIKNISNTLDDTGEYFIPKDKTYIALRDRELSLLSKKAIDGKLTTRDLFDFKNDLGNKLPNAFKKERGELNTALTVPEQVRMDLWRSMDEILAAAEPSIKEKTLVQSLLHEASPGLSKSAHSQLAGPIVGRLPQFVTAPYQAGAERLAQILESPAVRLTGAATDEAVRAAGTGIKKSLGTPTSRAIAAAIGRNIPEIAPEEIPSPQPAQQPTQQPPPQPRTQGQFEITPEMLNQAQLVLSPTEFSKIKAIYERQSGGTKPLTGTNAVLYNKAETAVKSIDNIKKYLDKNPNVVWAKALNPLSQEGRQIGSEITSAIDILGYFRTGAAITKEQRKDYIYMFPRPLDSAETKQKKIDNLKTEFQGYMEGLKRGSTGADQLSAILQSAQ